MNSDDLSKTTSGLLAVTAVVGLALAGPKHIEPEPVKAVDVQAQDSGGGATDVPSTELESYRAASDPARNPDLEFHLEAVNATTTTTTQPRRVRRTPTTRPAGRVHVSPRVELSIRVTREDAGGLLERIGECESGSNYTAQNRHSTASGRWQILDSTWGTYGGVTKARLAPPEVQDAQARELFARSGSTPWISSSNCWRNK